MWDDLPVTLFMVASMFVAVGASMLFGALIQWVRLNIFSGDDHRMEDKE